MFRALDERAGLASSLAATVLLGGAYLHDETIVAGGCSPAAYEAAGEEALRISRNTEYRSGQAFALLDAGLPAWLAWSLCSGPGELAGRSRDGDRDRAPPVDRRPALCHGRAVPGPARAGSSQTRTRAGAGAGAADRLVDLETPDRQRPRACLSRRTGYRGEPPRCSKQYLPSICLSKHMDSDNAGTPGRSWRWRCTMPNRRSWSPTG